MIVSDLGGIEVGTVRSFAVLLDSSSVCSPSSLPFIPPARVSFARVVGSSLPMPRNWVAYSFHLPFLLPLPPSKPFHSVLICPLNPPFHVITLALSSLSFPFLLSLHPFTSLFPSFSHSDRSRSISFILLH